MRSAAGAGCTDVVTPAGEAGDWGCDLAGTHRRTAERKHQEQDEVTGGITGCCGPGLKAFT